MLDAPENAAGCQVPRVIVDDPREPARSYRVRSDHGSTSRQTSSFVGASMLAMNPRTPWGVRCPASSLTTLASLLAPTGSEVTTDRRPGKPRSL
jgi:hypothetical protein